MNAFSTIATIMTRQLWTLHPDDNLLVARDLFNEHRIHHIPVVRDRQIVGLPPIAKANCTMQSSNSSTRDMSSSVPR